MLIWHNSEKSTLQFLKWLAKEARVNQTSLMHLCENWQKAVHASEENCFCFDTYFMKSNIINHSESDAYKDLRLPARMQFNIPYIQIEFYLSSCVKVGSWSDIDFPFMPPVIIVMWQQIITHQRDIAPWKTSDMKPEKKIKPSKPVIPFYNQLAFKCPANNKKESRRNKKKAVYGDVIYFLVLKGGKG